MKKLETKYRNDELSPAELQELRNRIKSMSDYEIGEEMYQTWMNEKIDVTSVPDNHFFGGNLSVLIIQIAGKYNEYRQ